MKELTKLSLFSGILGDDLASEWAGIKTVCCVELDKFCQAVIKKHYPDMPIIGDIHNVTKEKVKEVSGYEWVDIVSGGDPCQPRSVAGRRRGREDDRDLWKDMFRVICEFKPAWVVNENPTGRLTMDFHEVLSDLESAGYETRSFVIPACAVNAPHRRDRLFIIAHRNGKQIERHNERRFLNQSTGSDKSTSYSKSNDEQRYETNEGRAKKSRRFLGSDTNAVDSKTTRQRENSRSILRNSESEGFWKLGERAREPIIAQSTWQTSWYEVATALCRVDDGLSNRVARLKALGNACVPQQVYPVYRGIVEASRIDLGD